MRTTLVGKKRLDFLQKAAKDVMKSGLRGCYVECGVWRGGSAGVVGKVLKDRDMWLFDSFAGMPKPGCFDIDYRGRSARDMVAGGLPLDGDASDYDVCWDYLKSLGLEMKRVHVIKGWFRDTFRQAIGLGPLAILHLDCDFYDSVKLALRRWMPSVADGGYVIIDDYGHWRGCRKAVDEYLGARVKELHKIDRTGVWLKL